MICTVKINGVEKRHVVVQQTESTKVYDYVRFFPNNSGYNSLIFSNSTPCD